MGKKLLVADDSLTIQKVIKLALSNDGYEIQTVSDGNEAIQSISLFRPDVVLVDIALPGKSAFDVKKVVNADSELRKIPFVLMSSAFEKIDEAKVALLQFDGRLTKPFDPSHLRQVLNQAVKIKEGSQGSRPLPPPPPSPAPSQHKPAAPLPNFSERETGDISLSDPVWSDSEKTNPGINLAPPQPASAPRASRPMAVHVEEKSELPFSADPSSENDIKHLTESTVKMSGLDDLGGWNINESKKASPSLPEMFSEEKHKPLPPFSSSLTQYESPTATDLAPPPAPAHDLPSTAEIEEMVDKQVRAQLEEMMKRAIPDIAERVIKQEIKRLLEGLT